MVKQNRPLLLFLYLSIVTINCQSTDIVAKRIRQHEPSEQHLCDQKGPYLRVGDNALSKTECKSGEPGLSFRNALCLCNNFTLSNSLLTDSFDSRDMDDWDRTAGGDVSVNDEIGGTEGKSDSVVKIAGSLLVSGELGVTLPPMGSLEVTQNLYIEGELKGNESSVTILGDAEVGNRVSLDELVVKGSLTVPEGYDILADPMSTGELNREPVSVNPSCGCNDEDMVDIRKETEKYRYDNDNELLDTDLTELENITEGPMKIELPCGRFYLESVYSTYPITLSVSGRTALYVGTGVHVEDSFTVELQQDASLDLFIADSMAVMGDAVMGSPDASDRVRLYVGGEADFTLEFRGKSLVSGHIYAPRADLKADGPFEVYGSVFVRRIAREETLTIHYDRNPIESGELCIERI